MLKTIKIHRQFFLFLFIFAFILQSFSIQSFAKNGDSPDDFEIGESYRKETEKAKEAKKESESFAPLRDEQVESLLSSIEAIQQVNDSGDPDTDAMKLKESIVNELRSELANIDSSSELTLEHGKKIIDDVCTNVNKTNPTQPITENLRNAWKNTFQSEASIQGFKDYSAWEKVSDPYSGSAYMYKQDAESKAKSLGRSIQKSNILTWNNSGSVAGENVSDTNVGKILSVLTQIDGLLKGFMTSLSAISIALTIAFGSYELIQVASDRSVTPEMMTKAFIKMLIGLWFIYNYRYFALFMIRMGTVLTEQLEATIGSLGKGTDYVGIYQMTIAQSFANIANSSNIATIQASQMTGALSAGSSFTSSSIWDWIIGGLGNGIVDLVSGFVVYGIVIELGIQYVFTPIAIADLYSEKFRSTGWNWLKGLLATSLQGALIMLVIVIANIFKTTGHLDPLTKSCIDFAMLGMFVGTKSIAKQIVGTH